MKRVINILFLLTLLLALPHCAEEKNEMVRENNTAILPLGDALEQLKQLRDGSVYGGREGMYPGESKVILSDAMNELSQVILRIHNGESVSPQETEAAIAASKAAMEAFKATVRTEDQPVPAELFVDGIDGGGYINFGINADYSIFGDPNNQQFTVELWFKQTKQTGFGAILSTFYEGNDRYGWMINHWNNNMRIAYSMNTYEPLIEPAGGYNTLNEWVHLAAVYNDNGVDGEMDGENPVFAKFYINGNEVSRKTKPAGKYYAGNGLSSFPMIGFAALTSDGQPFRRISGYMKDMHIWRTAKSGDDVQKIMNREIVVTGSESDLVCGWSFDAAPRDNSKIPDMTKKYFASLHGKYEWIEID